ncbi:MAG: hypothetical protein ABIP74_00390 [Candidatus Saccharimonas sp.]
MKKFVLLIVGLVFLATSTAGCSAVSAEESANAKWFSQTLREGSRLANAKDSQGYDHEKEFPANHCVQQGWYDQPWLFEDHFNSCVELAEAAIIHSAPNFPSQACMTMPEKSHQQLQCIYDAEFPVVKALSERRRDEWEKKYKQDEKEAAAMEVQEAKEKAADKAITPTILKAIAVYHPNSDAERRQVAIYVSCKYDDHQAGYRVSLREYTKASQKGVRDAEERFDNGRYAICNQSATDGDDPDPEWVDDDGGEDTNAPR